MSNVTIKDILGKLEEIKKKVVVRKGKRVRKLEPKAGYKIVDGKYVRMSGKEKNRRSRSATKAAKKRRSKQSQITRNRKRSIKRRPK